MAAIALWLAVLGTLSGEPLAAPRPAAAPSVFLLGEDADASCLPAPAREGESLILCLAPIEAAGHAAGDAAGRAALARSVGGGPASAWIVLAPGPGAAPPGLTELLARVERAAHIGLLGRDGPGEEHDLALWLQLLFVRGRREPLALALHDAAEHGAQVVGRGPQAALLAFACVVRGATADEAGETVLVERNPRRAGAATVAWCLGLTPPLLFDTAGRSGSSLRRLSEVLVDQRGRVGLFLERASVVGVRLRPAEIASFGSRPAWVIDLRNGRRGQAGLAEARLTRLEAGGVWSFHERGLAETAAAAFAPFASGPSSLEREVADAFDVAGLDAALEEALRQTPPRNLLLRDGESELRIALDESTRGSTAAGGARSSLSGLRISHRRR
jgi:hypothetical protein